MGKPDGVQTGSQRQRVAAFAAHPQIERQADVAAVGQNPGRRLVYEPVQDHRIAGGRIQPNLGLHLARDAVFRCRTAPARCIRTRR